MINEQETCQTEEAKVAQRTAGAAGGTDAFMGIDIGSISTKGVIITPNGTIIARSYLWTEGNPAEAARRVVDDLASQIDRETVAVRAVGTTGSARRLVGAMTGAAVIKNEITAHAVGTTFLHPDVRTILEIGGQDSKIICVEDGIAIDYAMNTLCAAGTGAFLSSQAHRLGVEVEEFGDIALTSKKPANIAARCTVFAESDLVHKIQVGYAREDIIAGLCRAVATNYLSNVGKGKAIVAPVVFQGGVSKNSGVVKAFEDELGFPVMVDKDGHLMGAFGIALLAADEWEHIARQVKSKKDAPCTPSISYPPRQSTFKSLASVAESQLTYTTFSGRTFNIASSSFSPHPFRGGSTTTICGRQS